MITKPKETLDLRALTAWRFKGLLWGLVYLLILIGYALAYRFDDRLPLGGLWILIGLFMGLLVIQVGVIPSYRLRYWGYDIRDDAIDIQSGFFIIKRVLIPINRVQHIDLAAGPILRKYGLASVEITTAGSNHLIPALSQETALNIREKLNQRVLEDLEDV
jgi:membrane protein YdbS with pleckstrin-like domain